MREKKFIHLALVTAELSIHPRFRLGAVIVQGPRVLSLGINSLRSHPRQINPYTNLQGLSIHAELAAILRCKNTRGADLFVGRILRDGSPALAKPCHSCQAIIREAEIRRVYYSTKEGWKQWKLT